MANRSDQDQYSEQEAQQRFEKLVKAALNTKPVPLKGTPKKWSGANRASKRNRSGKNSSKNQDS